MFARDTWPFRVLCQQTTAARSPTIKVLSYMQAQLRFLYSGAMLRVLWFNREGVPGSIAITRHHGQSDSARKIVLTSKKIRLFLVLLVALLSGSAFAQQVTVVEFYNKTLDAYFITGRLTEQQTLDAQLDFRRTGMTFDAVAAASATVGTKRICRFYISLTTPPTSTHFYGREGTDCESIQAQQPSGFTYEGFDFAVAEPTGGVCPTGTKTVYRGFRAASAGKTPNHRYTTSPETYNAAQSAGYLAEKAVFCASQATDVIATVESAQKCGTFYFPGMRVTYQSLNSAGTPAGFQRFVNDANTTFNGRTDATAVVERFASSPSQFTMIVDNTATWTELGASGTDTDPLSEIYYSNPTVYPRDYAAGQSVSINRVVTYSRPNNLGTVTQTGKVTFVGKEAVSVPLGTYTSACKFVTKLVTAFGGTSQTTTTVATYWVADRLGVVKSIADSATESPSSPTVHVATTTEATFSQPL